MSLHGKVSIRRQLCLFLAIVLTPLPLSGQATSMAQDSTLDNLVHGPETATVPFGTLGRVRRLGEGPRAMLLIAGIGFGDDTWSEFMERHRTDYTMHAITLPGFGGTPPLPMPGEGSRFADRPWISSSVQAVEALLDRERLERVTIVGHWAVATQIALQLALRHPERVEAVILIGGTLKPNLNAMAGPREWTPEGLAAFVGQMGKRWFRTVTRRTWDDNNFMPYDYAVNPRRGLFLWREAQAPAVSVWVRYLLEFYSVDLTNDLRDLTVPTLVIHPDFEDPAFYVEDTNYMRDFCVGSWEDAKKLNPRLQFVTIPQSRLFIMHDQPEALDRAVAEFLRGVNPGGQRQ